MRRPNGVLQRANEHQGCSDRCEALSKDRSSSRNGRSTARPRVDVYEYA
jgi:hypothetical protein